MQQVKAFLANDVYKLRDQINYFLKTYNINIIDISMSSTEYSCQAIVAYEEK